MPCSGKQPQVWSFPDCFQRWCFQVEEKQTAKGWPESQNPGCEWRVQGVRCISKTPQVPRRDSYACSLHAANSSLKAQPSSQLPAAALLPLPPLPELPPESQTSKARPAPQLLQSEPQFLNHPGQGQWGSRNRDGLKPNSQVSILRRCPSLVPRAS